MRKFPADKKTAKEHGADAAYYRGQAARRALAYHYDPSTDRELPARPWWECVRNA